MRRTGVWALLLAPALVAGSVLAAVPAADAATGPGVITTVAGGPGQGPPRQVWQNPESVAAGPGGLVDVGDAWGVVRQFPATASYESVVAGVGPYAPGTGDGGPAFRGHLGYVGGLAFDHAGNTIIADLTHGRIQVIAARTGTFYGQAMTAGDIYMVAGNGRIGFAGDGGKAMSAVLDLPEDVAATGSGGLLIADTNDGRVRQVSG